MNAAGAAFMHHDEGHGALRHCAALTGLSPSGTAGITQTSRRPSIGPGCTSTHPGGTDTTYRVLVQTYCSTNLLDIPITLN